jgi:hypothetical protein
VLVSIRRIGNTQPFFSSHAEVGADIAALVEDKGFPCGFRADEV